MCLSIVSPNLICASAAENTTRKQKLSTLSVYEQIQAALSQVSSLPNRQDENAEPYAPNSYSEVPVYYQTDYPDVRYGISGTIATSGCSVTCLAMVATYLTGYTYLPDDLANYFADYDTDNNVQKLEKMSEVLMLPWEKASNFHVALKALKEGKIIIALMNEKSLFTSGQHFIVLTGINENGLITVNDPNQANYSLWNLERAFEEGFTEGDISCGYSGAWIYDPAQMPEEAIPKVCEGYEAPPTEGVPLYYQNDYPNIRYGQGSIATSGCSVTSLAMVASYLTGHTYMPDELADYFSAYNSENHMKKLEYMSDQLQLPWTKSKNFHYTLKALAAGKIVIALMEQKSDFTDGQHFIVLTGMTPEGKITVNDPNADNYKNWDLSTGFVKGFDEDQILKGYSGGWIYDPKEMPEEPYIYVDDREQVECRYPDVQLTLAEEELLARMVWVEARGESFEGQQAIAEIVLNRLLSGEYQDSIKGIIYADNQFRSTPFLHKAEPSSIQYEAVERALEGPYVLPEDVYYFATYAVNKNVWGTIGGHIFCYAEDK